MCAPGERVCIRTINKGEAQRVRIRLLIVCMLGMMLFTAGCETARGFSKDCKSAWRNLSQADEWFKENLW